MGAGHQMGFVLLLAISVGLLVLAIGEMQVPS